MTWVAWIFFDGIDDDGGLATKFDALEVDDINISTAKKDQEQPTTTPEQNEAAMEFDQPAHNETLHAEPEGFVLEPVDIIKKRKNKKKKKKRKTKLLVDNVTELSSDVIRIC